MRHIKDDKYVSKERSLNPLDEPESAKSLNNAKIEKIKESFNKLRDMSNMSAMRTKIKIYELKNILI